MKPVVLWIVGEPGCGKTTLVRRLIAPSGDFEQNVERCINNPKWTLFKNNRVAAGHYTGGTFDGADTVPYNGVQLALDYWKERLHSADLTIFDGDRFSHQKVFDFFEDKGVWRACILLQGDHDMIAERRRIRAEKAGRKLQNAQWVKGRRTKAKAFSEEMPWDDMYILDVIHTPEILVDRAQGMLEEARTA